jgi:hypothetical protein
LAEIVMTKLVKMMGPQKGEAVFADTLQQLQLTGVANANQMKAVADHLIHRGGLYKMIGHSLMVEALLRGAAQ